MASKTGFEKTNPQSPFDWLAAVLVFILPLISIPLSGSSMNRWIINILLVLILGSMLFAFLLALMRGLPRWSLSYLGFVLTTFVFYGLLWGLWGLLFYQPWMLIFGPMDFWSLPVRIFYQGAMTAFMWFLVLLAAIILIKLFQYWSPIQALWQHIREDCTYLSYLVYGGLVFYIFIIFDEYQHENPWIFAAFTSLAIGGWLYLRAREQKMCFLALIGGATAAMWIVAIGKWVIIPMQNWPVNLEAERLFEPLWAVGSRIVTIAAICAPAFMNLLPSSPNPSVDEKIISS